MAKKKERVAEDRKALDDYYANAQAVDARTVRLRALRLAQQATVVEAPAPKKKPAVRKTVKKAVKTP